MRNAFLVIWTVLTIASCSQPSNSANITGAFDRTVNHEAYTLHEVYTITKDEGGNGRYLVESRSVTEYKDNTKVKERKKDPYPCVYDPSNKVLQAPDPGLSLYFDDKLESFRIGTVTFNRVK